MFEKLHGKIAGDCDATVNVVVMWTNHSIDRTYAMNLMVVVMG